MNCRFRRNAFRRYGWVMWTGTNAGLPHVKIARMLPKIAGGTKLKAVNTLGATISARLIGMTP